MKENMFLKKLDSWQWVWKTVGQSDNFRILSFMCQPMEINQHDSWHWLTQYKMLSCLLPCLTLCSCKCRKVRESAGNGAKNRGNGEKRWERARNGEKQREVARNGQKFWHEIAGSVIFVGPISLSMYAFHTSYTKFSFSCTIESSFTSNDLFSTILRLECW